MKKGIIRALAFLAVFCLAAGAAPAPANAQVGTDNPLFRLYEAGKALLTEEENFTASGQADFYLDEELFKHAVGLYAQEGTSCYQQIDLESPRLDGTIRKNGYAVVDLNGEGYAVETYLGKDHYKDILNMTKSTALRSSVSSLALMDLGQDAAALLDREMADSVTAAAEGENLRVSLEWDMGDLPPLVNPLLNLFFQEAAGRYFSVLYHDMSVDGYASIEDYYTVTEGILYGTRNLAFESLSLSALLNDEGRLLSLSGSAAVQLLGRNMEVRQLTVSFDLKAENYGTTVLTDVIPEEKKRENLTDAVGFPGGENEYSGVESWENYGLPDIPTPISELEHEAISSPGEAVAYAQKIADMDSLSIDWPDQLSWTAVLQEDRYEVTGTRKDAPDRPAVSLLFDIHGQVLRIENHETALDQSEAFYSEELDTDLYLAWREELSFMVWSFEEHLNPGATMLTESELREQMAYGHAYTGYDSTRVAGGERFEVFYGTLHREPTHKVKYIIQTAPEVRIVLRDGTVDPMEGGNG